MSAGIVDQYIRAEGLLDRKLMVLAVSHPLVILEAAKDFDGPQIDLKAREFWARFIAKADEIKQSEDPIAAALECADPMDVIRFNILIEPFENCYTSAEKIIPEINAVRVARRCTRWLEESNILQRARNYGN